MELVFERDAVVKRALAALPRPCRVPRLNHEVLDDPVPHAAVVVAVQTKLHEIATRFRALLGPQLDFDLAMRGGEQNLALGGGLELVHARHREKEPRTRRARGHSDKAAAR